MALLFAGGVGINLKGFYYDFYYRLAILPCYFFLPKLGFGIENKVPNSSTLAQVVLCHLWTVTKDGDNEAG